MWNSVNKNKNLDTSEINSSKLSCVEHQEKVRVEFSSLLFFIWMFVFIVIGWCIPEDIFTVNAWAEGYTNFMSRIFPTIDWVSQLEANVERNAYFQALLWPFAILWGVFFGWDSYKRHKMMVNSKGQDFFELIWKAMCLSIMVFGIIYIWVNLSVDDKGQVSGAYKSTFFYPIINILFNTSVTMFLVYIFIVICSYFNDLSKRFWSKF